MSELFIIIDFFYRPALYFFVEYTIINLICQSKITVDIGKGTKKGMPEGIKKNRLTSRKPSKKITYSW
jgi:hypothetical protein